MAGAALLLVWANLAVGIIGEPGNPANLLYFGVLAVLVIGPSIARLEPRAMSLVLFATAGAQALVAVIALVAGQPVKGPVDLFFIGLWVASGLLFRQATWSRPPRPDQLDAGFIAASAWRRSARPSPPQRRSSA